MNKKEKSPNVISAIFQKWAEKKAKQIGPSSFELEAAKSLKDLEKSYKK